MKGTIQLYGGGEYALPPLLEWEIILTGGVPCDSFRLSCPWGAGMTEKLDDAWRIVLSEGAFCFRALIDEYELVQDSDGRTLQLRGRGLGALLLDNEAMAVEYRTPTLSELLKNHVESCGLSWEAYSELRGKEVFSVAGGSSQWKALAAFTRYAGGFLPRITPMGVLPLSPWKDSGKRRVISGKTPVLRSSWRDQRYGVYSEVLVVDQTRQTVQSVKNTPFLSRGGCYTGTLRGKRHAL